MSELATWYVGACFALFALGWGFGTLARTLERLAEQL